MFYMVDAAISPTRQYIYSKYCAMAVDGTILFYGQLQHNKQWVLSLSIGYLQEISLIE